MISWDSGVFPCWAVLYNPVKLLPALFSHLYRHSILSCRVVASNLAEPPVVTISTGHSSATIKNHRPSFVLGLRSSPYLRPSFFPTLYCPNLHRTCIGSSRPPSHAIRHHWAFYGLEKPLGEFALRPSCSDPHALSSSNHGLNHRIDNFLWGELVSDNGATVWTYCRPPQAREKNLRHPIKDQRSKIEDTPSLYNLLKSPWVFP
jgi:hypothetical protein